MPRKIKFIQLQLTNFTNHKELTVDYADITKLSGQNGEGKTSIGTAPAWILYGTDLLGAKFNPSPTNYSFDRVFASLLLSVDGAQILLAREIVNGDNKFYRNEVPMKAKEYDAFVAELFEKEMFLSLYNPAYFFTMHWTKQREQIMKYVTPPANKEVFTEMSRTTPDQKAADIKLNPHAERLAEELKKLSIPDLEKKHKDLKLKNEKAHTQSQGSVQTLSNQLQALGPATPIDREALVAEGEKLDKQVASFDDDLKKVTDRENERRVLQARIDALVRQRAALKEDHTAAGSKQIETNCNACGQELTETAKETATKSKEDAVKAIALRYNGLNDEIKELRAKLEALPSLPAPEYSVTDLVNRIGEINVLLQSDAQRTKAAADLEKARTAEIDYLKAKNDSIFVLDATKAFKATEATLQVNKVQSLFTTLSVRLFDYVKSSDDYTPTFVIQMDGKDYSSLSAGEKIGAGLELTEVLFKQSELIVPCFIDGIESYTGKVSVYDQLITGRAVAGQTLKIEKEEVIA